MAVVTFDQTAFLARYPEFTGNAALAGYFAEAGLYLDNTDASRVKDVTVRAVLLNMLTAHIAQLAKQPAVVGRINNAVEGSVTVATEYVAPATGTQAWYIQTAYGAAYWAATAKYRRMRYVPKGRC